MAEQGSDPKFEMTAMPAELYQGEVKKADVDSSPRGESPVLAEAPGTPGKTTSALKPPSPGDKPAALSDLSRKSRVFLELLVNGHTTLEAYDLAGFKGAKHAAYQLRSDLRGHLALMLESHGVGREDVKLELLRLLKLPTTQESVDVTTKLKLLKFLDKLTESEAPGKPAITPFLVQIDGPGQVNVRG